MWLARKTGRTFRPQVSVAAMRAGYVQTNARYGIKRVAEIETRELTIPTDDGTTIGARLFRRVADAGRTLPVLLYFHGGGWVIGDVDSYDRLTRYFACEGRIAVISVDYRLGPEHRFPRAHEDACDAYAWLLDNGEPLGVDVSRIAVGGDSAGGGLAASIAAEAEPRGLARPTFSLLIYPSVDGTARYPSRLQYTSGVPLTPATIAWFRDHATNGPADGSMPFLVPLDAPHPERLPPTYVLAAQHDPLVDEGRAYYERLRAVGVPVVYDLRPALAHGFVNLVGVVPRAKRALRDAIRATAAALGTVSDER